MELQWRDGLVTLASPEDFERFGVVVHARPAALAGVAPSFDGIARFVDGASAWVSQDGLIRVAGRGGDAAWRQALDAMIAKARPHGWIDAATGDIRAHVEWVG